LEVVPGATHPLKEAVAPEAVVDFARAWFQKYPVAADAVR
jgi:hypothetical protein